MTNCDSTLSRRETRRRERRKAILEVAARSFLNNGYAATTMSSIAAEMGGSKGTLWSYFPSKEALFSAVLDDATTTYRERLAAILDHQGDLDRTLYRLGINLLQKVTSPDAIALNRLVTSEAGRFPEMGAIFYNLAPRHTRMLIAAFLEQAMDRGLLRKADPEQAARTFMTLLLSGCHQLMLMGQISQPTEVQIDADVSFALDCFLRAYAPDDRPA
ncbi:TetR/AcrR family transcriptional regulator [Sphingobium sp. EM0848]|uniref:TetR/AcrR family transcriptional regulator n=1 Tax=Sphingobium sp. EM0848 TaxID=2743473 RepID=UPI00159C91D2|nr:TetR/AcrR family transcriptional regulator [Sphingobium sp. EM0848]